MVFYILCTFACESYVSSYMGTKMGELLKEQKIELWYEPSRLCTGLWLFCSKTRNMSRFLSVLFRIPLPCGCLRKAVLGIYSKIYDVQVDEAEKPLKEYSSLHEFFTRKLKPDLRPISQPEDHTAICSPCDGEIFTIGYVDTIDSAIDCVKGRSYHLDEFLLNEKDPEAIK